MPRSYDSFEDLIHDLDHEGIVDADGIAELDDEDLSLLAPPVIRKAPAAPPKKRGRPKKAA
ncbi:hypothetical protein HOT99_gp043 [Caulobacter phage CcrBL10]|uniref:Uncharacterized protein n=1 Tax=Caulobacter phage CcrBL10 TaxID=2283269 RepID=A0A385EBR6_9CAUD|nr:hypothetical protein HOT99_gp043 [Caulobacter phage CcrBL10]AXQ68247.1 hypothetical protein CcrBL10_gp043 [Caulobacter phage CcrBL10]